MAGACAPSWLGRPLETAMKTIQTIERRTTSIERLPKTYTMGFLCECVHCLVANTSKTKREDWTVAATPRIGALSRFLSARTGPRCGRESSKVGFLHLERPARCEHRMFEGRDSDPLQGVSERTRTRVVLAQRFGELAIVRCLARDTCGAARDREHRRLAGPKVSPHLGAAAILTDTSSASRTPSILRRTADISTLRWYTRARTRPRVRAAVIADARAGLA